MSGIFEPQRTNIPSSTSDDVKKVAIATEYKKFLAGSIVSVICFLSGVGLVWAGISGHVTWTTKVWGFEGGLWDASPGVVLIVIGALVFWISRYDLTIEEPAAPKSWWQSWWVIVFAGLLSLVLVGVALRLWHP